MLKGSMIFQRRIRHHFPPQRYVSSLAELQATKKIVLTPQEAELFTMFTQMVADKDMKTTVRVAGGWVRDKLLGYPGKPDIDIALDNISGKEFALALNEWNAKTQAASNLSNAPLREDNIIKFGVIKSNPDQSKHLETATARMGAFSIDFVNLRSETYSQNSRIPKTVFGSPLEDAERRDLTINSLFYNLNTGTVEDFTGAGLKDLSHGRVDTPLSPLTTLQDDPLRAMRAVRFACRYQFDVSQGLVKAIRHPLVHAALYDKVSRERVKLELTQLLSQADSARVVRAAMMLHQLQLLPLVFITDLVEELPALRRTNHGNPATKDIARSMLASLHPFGRSEEAKVDEVTIARYSALTSACAGWEYSPGGTSYIPTSHAILSVHLKMAKKDLEAVSVMHASVVNFREMLTQVLRYNQEGAAAVDSGRHDKFLTTYKCIDRAQLGLIMRQAGSLYIYALEQAVATVLVHELFAVQQYLNPCTTEQTLVDIMCMLSTTLYGSSDSFKSSYRLSSGSKLYESLLSGPKVDTDAGDRVLEAARDLVGAIRLMKLNRDYNDPPLLNGTQIKTVLPHIPPGPAFGEIMTEVTRWGLSTPPEQRFGKYLVAHLKKKYKE
eukprot:GSChrysophyteH1.ASY1.ANO1.1306.1 assembled CDS